MVKMSSPAKTVIPQRSRGLAIPSEADQAELLRLRELFREHHVFYVVSANRGVRYLALGAEFGARPHTVITDDLDELRYELEQAVMGA